MHVMLRGLGLVVLLLVASSGAVFAMDPSATEETNCLMACDANQEHCASIPRVTAPKNYSSNYSVAAHLPPPKVKAIASSRRPIEGR
jgi:hypothetical protein